MAKQSVTVFISYAHEDVELARAIQAQLEEAGYQVWIDEGALRAGDSLIRSITSAIHEMEFVVTLITEASVTSRWCQHEIRLAMTSGLNREGVKVLPVRVGGVAIPGELEDTYCAPLDPEDLSNGVSRLVSDVRSHHEDRLKAAAAGEPLPTTGPMTEAREPQFVAASPTGDGSDVGPIRIVGIAKEEVGRPRNDGTRGSGLYVVPIRLSRTPSREWSRFLIDCWNHPPSFTSMHRPGIASVHSNTIVLDGTTMEEMEKYHAATLRLCVDKANENEAARLERKRHEFEREEAERKKHERQIDEIAKRLRFDDE